MIRCVCSVHVVCLFRVLSVADDYAGLSARSE